MNNPLVSIVIPVYNGEKYISETIDSVLNQTISNIELIVVNDGSIDNTMELLLDKQRKDTRIRLINKANSGVCSTRNVGIKNSNGTYIAFLDADDLWESDNLEEKIEAIKNSGCKWAYSNLYFIDETNKRKETTWSLPKIENFADDIYLCDKSCVCGASSNVFVDRNFMNGIFFDETISSPADIDFCIQLTRRGIPVFVDKQLWSYRVHGNSMSTTNLQIADDMDIMYKKYKKQKYFSNNRIKSLALYKIHLMLFKAYVKYEKKYLKGVYNLLIFFFYRSVYSINIFLNLNKSKNAT